MEAISYPSHAVFSQLESTSAETLHCACQKVLTSSAEEEILCLDSLCTLPPDCSYSVYENGDVYQLPSEKSSACVFSTTGEPINLTSTQCEDEKRCNWYPFYDPWALFDSLNIEANCLGGMNDDFFCSVTTSSVSLYSAAVNLSEEECRRNPAICVTPLGSILLKSMKYDECDAQGL